MVDWKEDLCNVAGALLLIAGMKLLERLDLYLDARRNALQQRIEYRHTSIAPSAHEYLAGASSQTERDNARARYISLA